jgi:alpha-mannosidase
LLGLSGWAEASADAWWKMAFVESHDVYTGSHPTFVYNDTINHLRDAERTAHALLDRAVATLAGEGTGDLAIIALNGLPYRRDAVVSVMLPADVDADTVIALRDAGRELPFEREGRLLRFRTTFSGLAAKRVDVEFGRPDGAGAVAAQPASVAEARIAEGDISVIATRKSGLEIRLAGKEGTRVVRPEIVIQEDRGSFQIEHLMAAEISSRVGSFEVVGPIALPLAQRLSVRGSFPALWQNEDPLAWQIDCTIYPGRPDVHLRLKLNWRGEAARVRLKVATDIESSTGIFEVPFGTVKRQPYHSRRTAKGEWPVHRWVALEEAGYGVALVNSGHVGAEVSGGAIWQTLLRAPVVEYAGMVVDDTSSQHGEHEFDFALLPYEGSWADCGVIGLAQDLNTSVQARAVRTATSPSDAPLLTLSPPSVVLSGVKAPEDGAAREVIVRVYEATGRQASAELAVKGASSAWHSDLLEARKEQLACPGGHIEFALQPFEIKTLRIRLD